LEIEEKILGPEHRSTASTTGSLGELYFLLGNYARAEPLLKRALEVREKIFGPDSPDIAAALNSLADLYRQKGEFAEAESLCGRALAINERSLGPENPGTVPSLNRLAQLYVVKGDFTNAEALYLRSSNILAKVYGPDHQAMASGLDNLAQFYKTMGNLAKAESLSRRALEIRQRVYGPDHPATASSLDNLARVYLSLGDLAKAEPLSQRALEAREKSLGAEHPAVASSALSLAQIYQMMGDYSRALMLSERALSIYEKSCGPTNPSTAAALSSVADLYITAGATAKAESLYERALKIDEEVYGQANPTTAATLNRLAQLYMVTTNYLKAEPLFQTCLGVMEKVYGPEHPATASTLNDLARLYLRMGQYSKAEPLCVRALNIREKVLGPEHPATAAALYNLGFILLELEQPKKVLEIADREEQCQLKMLANVLSFTSEHERLAFQAQSNPYSLLACLGDGMRMARAILRNKGIVLDSLLEDRLLAESSENPEEHGVADQIEAAKQRLTQLLMVEPKDLSGAALQQRAEARRLAFAEVERLEGQLAQNVAGLGRARRSLSVTVESVQAAIPPNTALVEFLFYRHYLGKDQWERRYGATVVTHSGEPKWVCLGPAADIETNIQVCQRAVRTRKDQFGLSVALKRLYEQLCSPIEPFLPAQVKNLVLSPDGALNFLSFATLLAPDRKFAAEKFSIRYVSSGRDLLAQPATTTNSELVIFASPNYSTTGMTKPQTPGVFLAPLPGFAQQAKVLETKAKQWKWAVQVYSGSEAAESQVRAVRSPRILHFATHGFVLPEFVGRRPEFGPLQLSDVVSERQTQIILRNPMHRCGLALAGAQDTLEAWKRGEVPPTADDGILTAEEVGALHLQGTWLVALSACDTGAGKMAVGEGVMGLRRGFVQAGARNLLLTLWPVAVDETSHFMVDFYYALHETKDPPRALADVQRDWLVSVRRREGLLPAVLFAGPFILSSQGSMNN
jgi:tetratricopeptide (TPR) repeat protein